MGVYGDLILDRSLGTTATKTQLSGDRSGSATDYTTPASMVGLLYVEPYIYIGTAAANDAIVATLKIESDDNGIKDFEVFAPPISGITTVSASTISTGNIYIPPDLNRNAIYPCFFPVTGGSKIQFFGVTQSAPSSTAFMGATIWWTDDPAQLTDRPYRARVGGTPGASGSLTSTGTTGSTAGTPVTGATITLAGQPLRTIRGAFGILAGTTPTAAKPTTGYFTLTAPEIAYILRYGAEPLHSPGTSLLPNPAKLTRLDNLSVPIQPPSTISTQLILTQAPSTAAIFAHGILYN